MNSPSGTRMLFALRCGARRARCVYLWRARVRRPVPVAWALPFLAAFLAALALASRSAPALHLEEDVCDMLRSPLVDHLVQHLLLHPLQERVPEVIALVDSGWSSGPR